MKKFLSGFLIGAILFSMIGALAVSYVAEMIDFKVFVNGAEFTSDPAPVIIEGRTFLPLRAMGEALRINVNWNEDLGQVEVGTPPIDWSKGIELIAPKNYVVNSSNVLGFDFVKAGLDTYERLDIEAGYYTIVCEVGGGHIAISNSDSDDYRIIILATQQEIDKMRANNIIPFHETMANDVYLTDNDLISVPTNPDTPFKARLIKNGE